mmetsp:Transcript_14287/g.27015  ORF Transcript_14287/g.27015 Transcript_14287/m.27015 type:complete len:458 (-) Transcript_14287:1488-2861(-)
MPFGVKWGSSRFQYGMECGFQEYLDKFLLLYIDNMNVHTDDFRSHLEALKLTFARCRELNLKLRREKCYFGQTSLRTMGFIVEHNKLRPDPKKVEMITSAPIPTDHTALRSFLGLVQFYRSMLCHLSHAAYPLYRLTSSKVDFVWTEEHTKAFEACKDMIAKDILKHTLMGDEDIEVFVDASKYAVCCVVSQKGRLINTASKVLLSNEQNWHIIEKEAHAISWGLNKNKYYLLGRKFMVMTDHSPLVHIFRKVREIENYKLINAVLSVAEFEFTLVYLPGKKNVLADFGTRLLPPTTPTEDDTEYALENLNGIPSTIMAHFSSWPCANEESKVGPVQIIPTPQIKYHQYDSRDFQELNDSPHEHTKEGEELIIIINGQRNALVPHRIRRPIFWSLHFPRHQSVNYVYDQLKDKHLYWPNMKNDLLEYLSSCECTMAKDTPPPSYNHNNELVKPIWAK